MDTALPPVESLLDATERKLRETLVRAERARQCQVADQAARRIRPWFYDDLVIHPIADPAISAALRGDYLPPEIERRVCWSLIRMFARRLRHAQRHPRLTRPARVVLEVAIRCELRRLAAARSAPDPRPACPTPP